MLFQNEASPQTKEDLRITAPIRSRQKQNRTEEDSLWQELSWGVGFEPRSGRPWAQGEVPDPTLGRAHHQVACCDGHLPGWALGTEGRVELQGAVQYMFI